MGYSFNRRKGFRGGGTYNSEVLTDSPFSYWRLGEPSGTSAADSVGSNTGTYVGSVGLGQPGLDGSLDTSVFFDGSGEYVTMGSVFSSASLGTVDCLIDSTILSGIQMIASFGTSASDSRFYFGTNGTNLWGRMGSDGGITGSTTLSTGTIYHVALTFDSGSYSIYLNGVLEATDTFAGNAGNGLSRIASLDGSSSFDFAGNIDEVATYASSLTATRLLAHAAAAAL